MPPARPPRLPMSFDTACGRSVGRPAATGSGGSVSRSDLRPVPSGMSAHRPAYLRTCTLVPLSAAGGRLASRNRTCGTIAENTRDEADSADGGDCDPESRRMHLVAEIEAIKPSQAYALGAR